MSSGRICKVLTSADGRAMTVSEWAAVLGMNTRTLYKQLEAGGTIDASIANVKRRSGPRSVNVKRCGNRVPSICWDCAKACGGCSWSKDYVPVQGWTATQKNMYYDKREIESYIVHECPMFTPDKPMTKAELERQTYKKPYRDLANAVIKLSADDYVADVNKLESVDQPSREKADALRSDMQSIEKFFKSEYFTILSNVDGEYLTCKLRNEHEKLYTARQSLLWAVM